MKVLFTGGLGYIGSHTAVEVLKTGAEIIIVDDLSNSKITVLDSIKKISGKDDIKFYQVDICDKQKLEDIFKENLNIDAVIHFAGYKAVGESVEKPLEYYRNNLLSTINLLELMKKYGCRNLVFSSSATVYSAENKMPLVEDSKLSAINPYGRTKLYNEQIIIDYQKANSDFNAILLRYFNPIGAHESGLIGEDPNGIPNNLMPYICKVATGEYLVLNVFGDDYNTKDGTGVRDYIHVVDLAIGHVKALEKLFQEQNTGLKIYNLGTGKGYSVLDIVNTFNRVNKVKINYVVGNRRAGDLDECYASPKKAEKELGFKATHSLEDMCRSSYAFAKNQQKK